ncbi:MAG TPA: class I tRNA ligase family protein, partial [Candidatus Saccharimonadales bacterium]|nr:class I tRNA ligase family protein [Candidatus Saccharimonadales bacterium]
MSKFYVCTAIPYVNDKPHLGHAMLHLYADVLARYHRELGDQVLFCAGTDEHGGKIAEKAGEAKMEPKRFADGLSQSFRDLLKNLNISNDRFIRTSDPAHEQRAQMIWKNLSAYIYKGTYEGWYCVGD